MRVPTRTGVVCGVAALALVAAGCSSDSDDSGSSNSDAAITIDSVEPENPLIPGNTTETGGGKVIDALFTGLVELQTEDAEPDQRGRGVDRDQGLKVYTIKLKTDWTFHDGTAGQGEELRRRLELGRLLARTAAQSASFFEQILGLRRRPPGGPGR